MTLSLIGYRGSGKSTVGAQLAARLNYDFIDSDEVIEQRAGKSIAAMFAEGGEANFRKLESQVIAELLLRSNLVLATGGGAILDPLSRTAMKLTGPVVWLQANPTVLLSRIEADETTVQRRPPLTPGDRETEVAAVLAQRWPLYQDAATLTVVTDGRTVTAIVDEIVASLSTESGVQW